MNWLILTILAVLSRAIYGTLTKVFSNHVQVSAITQSVILSGLESFLTLLISPVIGGISFHNFGSVWIVAVLMVLSQAFGNVTYFKGIEKLEASITQIAFSSIVIWGTFLSVFFLGSHFVFMQITGILLLLFAILLIQYRKGHMKVSIHMVYIFASAAFFAIFQVTSAELAKTMTPGTYLFLAYLGPTVLIGLGYWKKVSVEIIALYKNLKDVLKTGLLTGSASLFYFLFSYFAYAVAPDRGVVVLLLTTQVIVAVILGIIFLKERTGIKRKLIAGAIAVAASILIKT